MAEDKIDEEAPLSEAMSVVLGKPPAIPMSYPLYRYFNEHRRAMSLFLFVNDLATRADHARTEASKALLSVSPEGSAEARAYKKNIERPTAAFDKLKSFADIQSRNLVVAAVNNFLCYFSEIIQAAMVKRPDLLKSGANLRVDEFLAFKKRTEFIAYLVDRQVNDLSYGGLARMEDYVRDRLGIEPFVSDEARFLMIIAIEIRNIQTHNRGVVNDVFLSRVKNHMSFDFVRGRQFHVDLDEFATLTQNSVEVACRIDAAVASKFKIQRKGFQKWHGPDTSGGGK